MSWKISGLVWDLDLTHSQQSILLAMADHAEHDGSKVFPSVARIAWKTGYSERQVRRVMSQLREMEILILVKESNRYRPREYKIDPSAGIQKKAFRDDVVSPLEVPDLTPVSVRPDIATATRDDLAMSSDSSLTINKPPVKKRTRKRDPLLDHPAIIVYQEEVRLHVPMSWRIPVTEAVGRSEIEVTRWRRLVHDWIGRGWNKQNVKGMIEKFHNDDTRFPLRDLDPSKMTEADRRLHADEIEAEAQAEDAEISRRREDARRRIDEAKAKMKKEKEAKRG